MSEFEIKCEYSRIEKRSFFNNEKEKEYNRFWVKNSEIIPDKYCSKWKGKFDENKVVSWIWISDKLLKELNLSSYFIEENQKKQYKFILKLGEGKAAKFMVKNPNFHDDKFPWHNNMVLKTQDYFKNTVKKIGFWGNDNYFYEVDKKEKSPPSKPNQSNTNQNIWVKVVLVCLPFLILAFLLLIIKLMSKERRNKN